MTALGGKGRILLKIAIAAILYSFLGNIELDNHPFPLDQSGAIVRTAHRKARRPAIRDILGRSGVFLACKVALDTGGCGLSIVNLESRDICRFH